MRILGVDGSLNTGFADLTMERGYSPVINQTGVITAPVKKGMQRFIRYSEMAVKLLEVIEHITYDAIVIEGYSHGSKFNSHTMGEIGAVLRYFLWQGEQDRLIIEVPPTSLKMFVTGMGNAKKEKMMLEVFKRWAFDAKSNDEADAYGLAMFGFAWFDILKDMPKKNLGAMAKVRTELALLHNPPPKKKKK